MTSPRPQRHLHLKVDGEQGEEQQHAAAAMRKAANPRKRLTQSKSLDRACISVSGVALLFDGSAASLAFVRARRCALWCCFSSLKRNWRGGDGPSRLTTFSTSGAMLLWTLLGRCLA